MPRPRKDEEKREFIRRFMGDEEARDDFPTIEQRRRVAEEFWKDYQREKQKRKRRRKRR